VQADLEKAYHELLVMLKERYPEYQNLILTGGCALNCTNNAKIIEQKYLIRSTFFLFQEMSP